ncbi:MAG: hypothetical protein L6Q71_04455, partial [Planctomycetes bacterium]|nr:hypothetical protein [Planctomycetota bacterium]
MGRLWIPAFAGMTAAFAAVEDALRACLAPCEGAWRYKRAHDTPQRDSNRYRQKHYHTRRRCAAMHKAASRRSSH